MTRGKINFTDLDKGGTPHIKKDSQTRKFLFTEGVAERYGVSKKTVSNWVYSDRIPYVKKPGHRVMFSISELEAWEEDGHVRPR